jgi:hypothetical protein
VFIGVLFIDVPNVFFLLRLTTMDDDVVRTDEEGYTNDADEPLLEKSSTQHENEKHGAGFVISVFNLMNCILGGGLLALPHAIAKSGYVLFFLLFGIMAICTWYSIR